MVLSFPSLQASFVIVIGFSLPAREGSPSVFAIWRHPPQQAVWAVALHGKAHSPVLRYASVLHIFTNKSFCLYVFSLFIYNKTYFKV